jgi:hypothetical protein
MRARQQAPVNLLDLRPRRVVKWETEANGTVVLIIPKFKNRFAVRWFVPMLAKPNVRLKLDAYGSFVWNHCDGRTTVSAIGERMRSEFGSAVEPVYDRIALFLGRLDKEHFLSLREDDPSGVTDEQGSTME